ncbi:hypothetical protein C7972_103250 [Arenibacter sp. ARW7G5Y1]|nr:hypothetical protein C7972_103250 [Arenibacter sp. ARW7G5Y1]
MLIGENPFCLHIALRNFTVFKLLGIRDTVTSSA